MNYTLSKLDETTNRVGHRIWGFVIYRSVYGPNSDDAFAKYISYLQADTTKMIHEYQDSHPILSKLERTIFQGRDKLNNTTKADIKKHSDEWCRSDAAASEQRDSLHPIDRPPLARYQFCLHVDQESLDSVVLDAVNLPEHHADGSPFVNVVARNFPLEPPAESYVDDEDDEDDEDED